MKPGLTAIKREETLSLTKFLSEEGKSRRGVSLVTVSDGREEESGEAEAR